MIRKIRNKDLWEVLSETGERKFGTYPTIAAAKKRLKQVEYFKHLNKTK